MTLYKLHVTIWLTNQGIIEVIFRDGLLARTTGKESQNVRNSAWRSLQVLEIPSTWFLKSMRTTRWHITFSLPSEWLDRRLGWETMFLLWRRWRPTATKTLWMLLTSPLGYENVYILNHLTKISGRLSVPIWNPWEHCLVLLQTRSSWQWSCLCYQSW